LDTIHRQKRPVSRHAIECVIQPEALPHPGHGATENFHIAAGVVAADVFGIDPQP